MMHETFGLFFRILLIFLNSVMPGNISCMGAPNQDEAENIDGLPVGGFDAALHLSASITGPRAC